MKKDDILPSGKQPFESEDPANVAAGVKAVFRSFKEGVEEMGLATCLKSYAKLNQVKGFDCPSCAWPDPRPEDRSAIAEYCENGAKAVAEEATKERADPDFWKKNSVTAMMEWSEQQIGKSGRITQPMILREDSDHYEPITWDAAFNMIGDKLRSLDDPNEAVFYTSGRASNEAAFLYQLFARQYGTNNLPDCSNMCHESSGYGLSRVIGIGKGTVKLEDFYVTDCILIIGQNPGTNHPRMMSALQKAKRKGAKIISINPLPETGLMSFKNPQEVKGWIGPATELSDLFLQVRVNGDVALLKAILLELYELEKQNPGQVFDREFIEKYTSGYEELMVDLAKQEIETLSDACGIPVDQIREAARIISENKRMIICWAMGVTQHVNGVDNIREIVNLLLLRGSIGIPGAGACPIRGHSNVQGDRTVGVWDQLTPELSRGIKETFKFDPPQEHGYNVVKAIEAMHEGKVRFYMSLGGNLLLAAPDTNYTAEGIRNCDLTVMITTKPNRNHLVTGKTALILPCLGRTEIDLQNGVEQFVSTENSMGIVQKSQGVLEPASKHLMSEPAIVASVAAATFGDDEKVDWRGMGTNYDRIRDAIENCIPGFTDYNKRVRNPGGFYLPNGASLREFNTDNGKAQFSVVGLPDHDLKEGEYLMTTLRSHDQFNTTIYGEHDRYRGIAKGRRVVMMHPDDMRAAGLETGDYVDLVNGFDGVERVASNFSVKAHSVPRRCVATFFPEGNVLVPINKHDRHAYTPASKSVVVTIRKAD